MEFTTPAFREGDPIPRKYTADGADVSPPLCWDEPPEGTRSFALVCTDPDAPRGTWVHWVLYDLDSEARELPEGLPQVAVLPGGGKQGKNDFGKIGYGGPAPPRGKPHRYVFTLYALDAILGLPEGVTRQRLEAAIWGHALDQAQVMGQYARQ